MRGWLNDIQTPWFSGFCVSEPPSPWCHNISRLCRLWLLMLHRHAGRWFIFPPRDGKTYLRTYFFNWNGDDLACLPFGGQKLLLTLAILHHCQTFWVCFSCQAAINPNLCGMRVWGRRSYRSLLMSPADTTTTTPQRETTIYYGCHRVCPPSFYIARLLPECPSLLNHQRYKPSMKVMQVQASRVLLLAISISGESSTDWQHTESSLSPVHPVHRGFSQPILGSVEGGGSFFFKDMNKHMEREVRRGDTQHILWLPAAGLQNAVFRSTGQIALQNRLYWQRISFPFS